MSNTAKTKCPSKAYQVTFWYCAKTVLKQNFKASTETVHPGKPVREKVKGAAFDLFHLMKLKRITS